MLFLIPKPLYILKVKYNKLTIGEKNTKMHISFNETIQHQFNYYKLNLSSAKYKKDLKT